MQDARILTFGPFRVNLQDERVWRQETPIRLTHKAFAVLLCLVTRPGHLVTKDELFQTVWPEAIVSDSTLTVCIREVRRALDDQARRPQFIETVHGRGYRFIAPVAETALPDDASIEALPSPSPMPLPAAFVGRESELAHLHHWYAAARQGARQIGFIAGEAGIGKTALVETFMAQVAVNGNLWIGRGQCVDHYGSGEAYLPILEALGRLCRRPNGASLVTLLQQQAPSWIAQMPGLVSDSEYERLQRTTSEITQNRMLRELAETLETFTTERLLVLILEDLHWSDSSTLAWLTYVARRLDPARLLILGTYRPVETMVRQHPLRAIVAELESQRQCGYLTLDYLSEDDVATYARQRFGAKPLPTDFVSMLHQRTNGNPLFLLTVLDDLVRQDMLIEKQNAWSLSDGLDTLANWVPASLQRLIELTVAQLNPEEQELLEVASVAGSTFSGAIVAASIGKTEEEIEKRCAAWVRQGRLVRDGGVETSANGVVTSCYRFIHALYHEVLYARISRGRRQRLHQQIGAYKEAAYGDRAAMIAAELAVHFEQAQDLYRAVRYRQQAAENVIQQSALAEAVSHLSRGLDILRRLPADLEQRRLELDMQTALAMALMPIKGYLAAETEQAFARIRVLSQQVDESPQLAATLHIARWFYHVRGEYQTACSMGERLLQLGQRLHDPQILAWGHLGMGSPLLLLGDFITAQSHLEQAERLEVSQQRDLTSRYGADFHVMCLIWVSWATWLLGYPQQALHKIEQAIAHAQTLDSVHNLALALSVSTVIHQCRGEWRLTRERAEALITLCQEDGLSFFVALARIRLGWALAMSGQAPEGISQLHQGITSMRATGGGINQTYFLTLLAEAYAIDHQTTASLQTIDKAMEFVQTTGEHFYEAELYRLKGEQLLRAASNMQDVLAAESCFRRSIDIAQQQNAKSWELRAAASLARLWQSQGKRQDAYHLLAPVYDEFTEGFDTADLMDARSLLDELTGQ